jgi:outer membrane protein OmpA-like peptidoglycan-associated protein
MRFLWSFTNTLFLLPTFLLALAITTGTAFAQASKASARDIADAADSEVVGRLPGSLIIGQDRSQLDQVTYPMSELKKTDRKVGNNAYWMEPDETHIAEGERIRTIYLADQSMNPFGVVRAYEKDLVDRGAEVLWSCKDDICGGAQGRTGGIGGGWIGLFYYLWPDTNPVDAQVTHARCAQRMRISDQHYRLFKMPNEGATISVLAYRLREAGNCEGVNARTIAIVDVVGTEAEAVELTTVSAAEMQSEIASTGKIALYGINFDSGKDSLRSDSTDTINQIARLMTSEPELKLLIVGHTDSVGSFEYNQDLSERRSRSVVRALINQHGIAQSRLFPVGVAFASPVAPNDTDEGKAQNRRVELVKF